MGWNIYILFDSQTAHTALNSFQINCKLAWNYHKSMVKLSEHNRIQLIQAPGHMGIDGNEIVISYRRLLTLLIGPEPTLGISAEVAMGWSGIGQAGTTSSIGSP